MRLYASKIPEDYYFSFFDSYCIAKQEKLFGEPDEITIKYSDIKKLGWKSECTTVNYFSKNYKANLTIKYSNHDLSLMCKKGGIGDANYYRQYYDLFFSNYIFLAKITFKKRLQIVLDEINEKGFYKYGEYKIFIDGRIVIDGKDFIVDHNPISDDNPFKFNISPKGAGFWGRLFGSRAIDIEFDKDVFIYLQSQIGNI